MEQINDAAVDVPHLGTSRVYKLIQAVGGMKRPPAETMASELSYFSTNRKPVAAVDYW